MAITSDVVFWIDPDNGVDTGRNTLLTCIASNPSGTIVRITKNGHGLQTGAVVDLTLFDAWLNGAYVIAYVDANNFDLQNTVWQTTVDNNGTVAPRGGNINDPWKTLTSGATVARLAGLTSVNFDVRYKKSPDPVSLGTNVTFTMGSRTGTLDSALTLTIDNCETAWTAEATTTTTVSVTNKQGTYSALASIISSTTGPIASKDLGSNIDLSSYTGITFQFKSSTTHSANALQIRMYSDVGRTTLVETLAIPGLFRTSAFTPVTILKGSPLSNSVRVIELYANAAQGVKTLAIDNISACNANFHLRSLVGVNDGLWMPMDWIDGTTFALSYDVAALPTSNFYGWPKASVTATGYTRSCFIPNDGGIGNSAANVNVLNVGGGSVTSRATYSFGWNLTNQTRDGETWFDGLTCYGYLFALTSGDKYIDIRNAGGTRFYLMFYFQSNVRDINMYGCKSISNTNTTNGVFSCIGSNDYDYKFDSCIGFGGTILFTNQAAWNLEVYNCEFYSAYSSLVSMTNTDRVIFKSCIFSGCTTVSPMISFSGGNNITFNNCTFKNSTAGYIINPTNGAELLLLGCTFNNCNIKTLSNSSGHAFIVNCSFDNLTNLWQSVFTTDPDSGYVFFHNLNNVANDHRIYGNRATILTDNSVYHGLATYSWKLTPIMAYPASDITFPVELELHKCVCTANVAQTIKVWVQRDNTNLSIGLRVKTNALTGITQTDAMCTAAINTWQQVTLIFTPTQSGVVTIYGIAYGGTTYNGWISDLTPMSNISTKKLDIAYLGQPFSSNSEFGSGSPCFAYIN